MKLRSKKVVVLSGAGISSESGLKTFRDAGGLWEGHRVEDVATPEAFAANPDLVHNFYNARRRQLSEVAPNPGHQALAEFERQHDSDFTLITQNVDDLHERAGSQNVLHMHGELKKVRCVETGEVFDWQEDLSVESLHPKNQKKGLLRPHICWFGEVPFFFEEIMKVLEEAECFIAVGTSGYVYPAAAFVSYVRPQCKKILINKEEAQNHPHFDQVLLGEASEILAELLGANE